MQARAGTLEEGSKQHQTGISGSPNKAGMSVVAGTKGISWTPTAAGSQQLWRSQYTCTIRTLAISGTLVTAYSRIYKQGPNSITQK